MTTTLPYGSWPSPITAESLAAGGTALGAPQFAKGRLWWQESRASEGGRIAVMRSPSDPFDGGEPQTILPAPWSARTRVHEYGGSSWLALEDGRLLFVEFSDQRVYLMKKGKKPKPLTPVGPEVAAAHGPSLRWASPTPVTLADGTAEVWWICEDQRRADETGPDGAPLITRYIAAVPLDGSAANDPTAIRRVTPRSRFVDHPRISPDGLHLAWISWEHPQMPWDGTRLSVGRLVDGKVVEHDVIAGGPKESVLQPEWLDARRLAYVSDLTGWWTPVVWSERDGDRRILRLEDETAAHEWAGPLWQVGASSWAVLDEQSLLAVHGTAATAVAVLDATSGRVRDLDLEQTWTSALALGPDGAVALISASPTQFPALRLGRLDLSDPNRPALADLRTVRSSREDAPPRGALPRPEPIEVPLEGGGVVHAIWFPPRQRGLAAPEGELPPVIASVHGGPTSQVPAVLSLATAYWTSRGIGVVEINYGGSTGYGRAYRDRLKGQWGIVDVEDTVAVMDWLVEQGLADPDRLAIQGGSAGGFTTLACLTRTDRFDAGVSRYGVADITALREDTHDFESRYMESLVGPYPQAAELYVERSPLSHVEELSCPVLLLQGEEDLVVPPAQSEAFRDALAAKGIPYAYLLFEGEQHGFRRAESIIRAQEASLSFYGQVLGFEPDGIEPIPLERG